MKGADGTPEFALSIKQPWATLVLLGLKTIEIRRWTASIRGRIYLHAGKIPDERLEGWSRVPEVHFGLTSRRGGIIGAIDLVECVAYSSLREFTRSRQLHFNEPSWYLPPRMFGFRFERPTIVPFRPFVGQVKFFPVPPLAPKRPKLAIAPSPPDVVSLKPAKKKRVKFELD